VRLEYFELLDCIEELHLDQGRIRASGRVPAESPVFEGHFPGHALMPGVLLIEVMAQASGWLLLAKYKFERMVFLAAVKRAKLRAFVQPNAVLDVTARLLHDGSGFAITSANITQDDRPIADAELTLTAMPFPSPDFAKLMRKRASELGLKDES
jgi:3-hydroxyacyl-[acyl-carrier-protein] dehydratase